ncbi:malto-oligosyltrehalose trehalohydrolase [Mesorhizobium sp. RP14(2022)]|uniref:Malto-oligosyltrehalose trehalohydrolase n=1 Tax=Mesorhizobium liriopis TaxID=2953882 RepID=A0ABT1C823_9HYPH|nr:malto-oligosyltrehalose trehalohydrolase [Mesorhizobium liriopis]
MSSARRYEPTWGVELHDGDKARFRIWAPGTEGLSLRLGGEDRAMDRADDGWFTLDASDVSAGTAYAFVLPDGLVVPDPASRAQEGDVHGPSVVCDPDSYQWQNAEWKGRPWEETVISEIHIGTFSPAGTFRSAIEKLPELVEAGITAVEVMPIAQFGGERGWGYDGVLLYAPHRAYGTPDDFKAFVDAAHGHGLMVFLDVIYNHFGPDGNYLPRLAPDFFHPERHTPWGAAIAYEKTPVRRFFIENVLYWLDEFRLDGLRFDAVDHIRDVESKPDILTEMALRVREVFPDRPIHLATEDNRNITSLHERGEDGSVPLHTAEWNDDFHNAAHVVASGETDGYYEDFADDPIGHVRRILAEGFAYQGEPSRHADGETRGVPSAHQPPQAFVDFLQNHDQIGNRAMGDRLITLSPEPRLRVLSAILLLSPHIPLLFMGEEWGETNPFFFFTDFHGQLADAVREGRRNEFSKFSSYAKETIPDPNDRDTFERSKIDWLHAESARGQEWRTWTKTLLALRQKHVVPALKQAGGHAGRMLDSGAEAIAVDWTLGKTVLRLRARFAKDAALPEADGKTVFEYGSGDDAYVRVSVSEGAA